MRSSFDWLSLVKLNTQFIRKLVKFLPKVLLGLNQGLSGQFDLHDLIDCPAVLTEASVLSKRGNWLIQVHLLRFLEILAFLQLGCSRSRHPALLELA